MDNLGVWQYLTQFPHLLKTKKAVPDVLYHYTTRKGLLGIVKSKKVWATDIRYLNDATEYEVATRVFKAVSETFLDKLTDPHEERLVKAIRQRIIEIALLPASTSQAFVFSMSEDGDSLSQWRAYTKPGDAYAIGLSAKELVDHGPNHEFAFISCIYDQAQHAAVVEELLSTALTEFRSLAKQNNTLSTDPFTGVGAAFVLLFLVLAPALKDPAFSEEREWRLVAPFGNPSASSIQFREGKTVLVPYVELPLEIESGRSLISHVVIGPSPHKSLDAAAVLDFCKQNGTSVTDVKVSPIPYREV